jgi:hypothetical protein
MKNKCNARCEFTTKEQECGYAFGCKYKSEPQFSEFTKTIIFFILIIALFLCTL